MEKESLGLYVSEHPLTAVKEQLARKTDCRLAEAGRGVTARSSRSGGSSARSSSWTTRKGDPMVFARLDDLTGSAEVVASIRSTSTRASCWRRTRFSSSRAASTTSKRGRRS